MRARKNLLFILLSLMTLPAMAKESEYVRDYDYHATKFDSEYTSRINAIEGVKTSLLDELGTYIQSVVKIKEDSKGNDFFSNDTMTLTAGIVSMKVLDENWNLKRYYVKASMKADPDDVRQQLKALRADHELEDALRDSLKHLKETKQELNNLKQQLATVKDAKMQTSLANDYLSKTKDLEAEEAFRQVMQAQVTGNFDKAFARLQALANEGYAKAQMRLGFMYDRGIVLKQDYATAIKWYEKAIKNGDADALVWLGFMYQRGTGVEKNSEKSAELYREGINKGSKMAYAFLGTLYQVGEGVPQDFKYAFKLYKKGEALDDPISYARLGAYYMTGAYGQPQDYEKARDYFTKSAKQKGAVGMAYLGMMNLQGWGAPPNYELGKQLIRESVRYDIPLGLSFMGFIYEQGLGEKQDYDKALEWYKKSVKVGSPFGEFRLGIMHLKGWGVMQDRDEGLYWLKKAADKGQPQAKMIYENVSSRF